MDDGEKVKAHAMVNPKDLGRPNNSPRPMTLEVGPSSPRAPRIRPNKEKILFIPNLLGHFKEANTSLSPNPYLPSSELKITSGPKSKKLKKVSIPIKRSCRR